MDAVDPNLLLNLLVEGAVYYVVLAQNYSEQPVPFYKYNIQFISWYTIIQKKSYA